MLLVIEDSPTWVMFLENLLSKSFPGMELVKCTTWMQAAPHISTADAVLIDWVLEDGVNARECGALKLLEKRGVPHLIWTISPDSVGEVGCPIVDKTSLEDIESALQELMKAQRKP